MQKCVLIGYPPGYKGWKFWDMSLKRSIISERADFDERYFPARKDVHPMPLPSLLPSTSPESVPAPGGRVIDVEPDTDSGPPCSVNTITPTPSITSPAPPHDVKKKRRASTSSSSSSSSSS